MSPMMIAWLAFACIAGAALLGMSVRGMLPEHHLNSDSKDVVKLAMGLMATLAALVVGLLIASAKGSYEMQDNELKQSAASILLLDRTLAHYGPETKDARDVIRRVVAFRLETTWPEDGSQSVRFDTPEMTPTVEAVDSKIRGLSPQTDAQRTLQSRALQLMGDLQRARWLMFEGSGGSLPVPFLVVLVFWVTLIFGIFGILAPRNATVAGVLLLSALSVATSIFLILEMSRPFEGVMKISSAPLRYALSHLGQ